MTDTMRGVAQTTERQPDNGDKSVGSRHGPSDYWFWSSNEWREYSHAYGSPLTPVNFGQAGNLVVQLAEPDDMLRRLSKGHRADVKRGLKEVTVSVLYGGSYPRHFDAFRELHAKAAGRITRSKTTWDIQRQWVEDGHAAMLFVGEPPAMEAASLFILHGNGSYYASAARDADVPDRRQGHAMVWNAMCWLNANGYEWLDMGPLDLRPTEKVLGIEKFKRGFGAELRLGPYE